MSDNKETDIVEEHSQERHLFEVVIIPEHGEREESDEFRYAKKRLKDDGHYRCWVCDVTDNLEVHHFGGEWALENVIDFNKLKTFCEEWDPYGYGRLLKNKPITSIDDIRNMLVLCKEHHTGVNNDNGNSGTGIHNITFSIFLSQKLAKKGEEPVPQEGHTTKELLND